MREIKFRAWDKKSNQMLYSRFGIDFEGQIIDVGNPMEYDYDGQWDLILMQYTGLKDKNGVEIYESDIIKWEDDYNEGVSKVVWGNDENTYPAFDLEPQSHDELNSFAALSYEGSMEVIGNVWENPELLKEQS